jgi:hypothetical protein
MSEGVAERRGAWWVPTFVDVMMAAVMGWLFATAGKGWSLLLGDGDTGWHIRTGEWILEHGQVPYRDLFSFSRAEGEWFAWEWLADVVFALLHRWGGVALLTYFAGFLLVGSAILLLRWIVWRGSNALVAFPLMMLAVGGSTVHYLARPHIFTIFLLVVTAWLLDAERREPSGRIWWLAPLTVLWTNLHGGWPVLFVFLGLQVGARLVYRDMLWRRDAVVGVVCGALTFCNPYTWRLHAHIFGYLQSDWIRDAVEEFQSPKFRSENLLQYEFLLLLGMACVWPRIRQGVGGLAEGLAVVLWAHLSLGSVRHAPIFIIAAVPVIATALTEWIEPLWEGARKSSVTGVFRGLDRDLRPKFAGNSVWVVLLPLLLWLGTRETWPKDFPEKTFPVEAVATVGARLEGGRVFASDQWGDYVIYQLWPRTRVYIDGRSDFYGPELGKEYLSLLAGRSDWNQVFERYSISHAVLPTKSELGDRLRVDHNWQLIHSDGLSAVFERRSSTAIGHSYPKLFSPPH